MNFLVTEIILWVALAAIIGFLSGWLLKIWPFWKRFNDYEKAFETYRNDCDKKINKIESDFNEKLKVFQMNYEERMRKFQTDYETVFNNFQNDYADGFSTINKESKILQKEMMLFQKDLEHRFSEYSSKYYYLENKFNKGFINREYELTLEELKEKIKKLDKQITTHKHSVKTAAKAKTATKKKIARANEKDNLQLITGIGKVLEGVLNKQKVYTFKQIADMSKDDIEKISKKIKGFSDKVKKYKWVNQAKSLYKKSIKK